MDGAVYGPGMDHLARMSRAYSPETWELYAELDRDLEPDGPDSLLDLAAPYLFPEARVLDAGCRDAGHLIALVERHGVRGVGVEPVAVHAGWARAAVAEAGLGDRVEIVEATLETADLPPGSADLVWCRDVLEQVPEPAAFLRVCARVLAADGRMIAYTNVVGWPGYGGARRRSSPRGAGTCTSMWRRTCTGCCSSSSGS